MSRYQSIKQNEIENCSFKIASRSPRGQWVNCIVAYWCHMVLYQWLSARLQYLHCYHTAYTCTAVLHQTIDMALMGELWGVSHSFIKEKKYSEKLRMYYILGSSDTLTYHDDSCHQVLNINNGFRHGTQLRKALDVHVLNDLLCVTNDGNSLEHGTLMSHLVLRQQL